MHAWHSSIDIFLTYECFKTIKYIFFFIFYACNFWFGSNRKRENSSELTSTKKLFKEIFARDNSSHMIISVDDTKMTES